MSEKLSRVEFAVKKYRLAENTFIEMEVNQRQLGEGRVMSEDCLKRFIAQDPSGNNKYLDWMLFQAGGGQETMARSLGLWHGDGPADERALLNQCRQEWVEEQVKGGPDEGGTHRPPIKKDEAEKAWTRDGWDVRSMREFIMGDQDVAYEDGFGFYRDWPGKDNIYSRLISIITFWHQGLPRLKAQNEKAARYKSLEARPTVSISAEDANFMAKCRAENFKPMFVELDIYKGWQPSEYSQPKAHYKDLKDILSAISSLRKQQVLNDIRHIKVYEDDIVVAVCPLTVGASIRFGSMKWCTANKTEFDRNFDGRHPIAHSWKTYASQGPLIYARFKVPMPEYMSMLALHIDAGSLMRLTPPWESGFRSFVDLKNANGGVTYASIMQRIRNEHLLRYDPSDSILARRRPSGVGVLAAPPEGEPGEDERTLRWGGRDPGHAWTTRDAGERVAESFDRLLNGVKLWAKTFTMSSTVLEPEADALPEAPLQTAVDTEDDQQG